MAIGGREKRVRQRKGKRERREAEEGEKKKIEPVI
jgi:hypothetical protein